MLEYPLRHKTKLILPQGCTMRISIKTLRCIRKEGTRHIYQSTVSPQSQSLSRRHLHSASRHHPTVPRYRLTNFGRRAFSVAGPTIWNSLPDSTSPVTRLSATTISGNYLRRTSSTITQHTQRSRDVVWLCCINIRLTLTLTRTQLHKTPVLVCHEIITLQFLFPG